MENPVDNNLAVLIDFENIAAGTEKDGLGRFDVELVLARLSDKGRILIARSYADWGRFARFKQGLLTNNVSMMELTSHGMHDKNRADIAMVVEGMELAFTKSYVDTFVIVSGDSDFTPMVLKMRELDKRVIGVGCRSSTSRLLIQACDEFIFYDSLAQRRTRRKAERPATTGGSPNLQAALDLLLDTLEGLQRENPDPPLAGMLKTAMLRKSPDFSENELGFSSFARFLEKARKDGVISLVRDEKSGGYRVGEASGATAAEDKSERGDKGEKSDKGKGRRGSPESDSDSDESTWNDPYLPAGTQGWVATLSEEGLNPLAAPTRKAVLQAIEEAVEERNRKKRRVTVQFVQEDVRRTLRRTHPDLPLRGLRSIFNALMRAGVFIHRDGTPVRTGSAPFGLNKSAEELNETLADIYVDELHRAGATLDIPLLAELFFGDRSHTRPIEESVAYLQATTDDDGEPNGDDNLDTDPDLDAALLIEDDDTPSETSSSETATAESADPSDADADASNDADAPKKPRRRKKASAASTSEAEPTEPSDPPKPKKSRKSTKAQTADPASAPAEPQAAPADASPTPESTSDDETAEAKPRRRRTRRKASDAEPTTSDASGSDSTEDGRESGGSASDDLDALLSED